LDRTGPTTTAPKARRLHLPQHRLQARREPAAPARPLLAGPRAAGGRGVHLDDAPTLTPVAPKGCDWRPLASELGSRRKHGRGVELLAAQRSAARTSNTGPGKDLTPYSASNPSSHCGRCSRLAV